MVLETTASHRCILSCTRYGAYVVASASDLVPVGKPSPPARSHVTVLWVVLMQSIPSYGPCGADALRPRMLNAVLSLGGEEVQSLLKEQGTVLYSAVWLPYLSPLPRCPANLVLEGRPFHRLT